MKLFSFLLVLKMGKRVSITILLILIPFLPALTAGCDYISGLTVEKYLNEVSKIQGESDSALMDLMDNLDALSGEPTQVHAAIFDLAADRQTVEAARLRLEELEAPDEASILKEDMLELYNQGALMLLELTSGADYRLAIEPLINEYEAASGRFSEKVENAASTSELADLVTEYQKSLTSVVDRSRNLSPSVLYARSHQRFVGNLESFGVALDEMARGLRSDDLQLIEAADAKLGALSGNNTQLQADMLADRQADYRDFNARITQMNSLVEKINIDQADLRQRFERE